jgi:hypothetical protein
MRKGLCFLALSIAVLTVYPSTVYSDITLTATYRAVSAQLDNNSQIYEKYGDGTWAAWADAPGTLYYLIGEVSSASQTSDINLSSSSDVLSATAYGEVRHDNIPIPPTTYSTISFTFFLSPGQYCYDFSLTGTADSSASTLTPGEHMLSVGVGGGSYTVDVDFFGSLWVEEAYAFDFRVASYQAVPLPGAVLLLGAGLLRLANYRRRKLAFKS